MLKVLKLFVIVFFLNQNLVKADIVKPNSKIKPDEVIKIQLKSLMKNDVPSKDNGIKQTWEFAHPNNQRFTGPLDNFTKMIKGDSYKMLIGHIGHEISELDNDNKKALYEVIILGPEKKYFKFRWQVEKFLEDGPLKNCWLTTVVSQPIPMGSST
tara:strand:+ start:59 stop:523 length:465 start_codon:yes stop_codon:yes gene_type:complete